MSSLWTTEARDSVILTAMDGFFGAARSLSRRKIAMYVADLLLLDEDADRQRAVMDMIGTQQRDIAARILQFEREIIVQLAKLANCGGVLDDVTTKTACPQSVRRILQQAEANNDIARIVHELRLLHPHRPVVQKEEVITLLQRMTHRNSRNKSRLVDHGGVQAILGCIQHQQQSSADSNIACWMQRRAIALVIQLPFLRSVHGESYYLRTGEAAFASTKAATEEDEAIDLGIVDILISEGFFEMVAAATRQNLFGVDFALGDHVEKYERTLAHTQILSTCNALSDAATRLSPKDLGQQFRFLRTCLASLLSDTSITTDTLSGIVKCNY